MASTDPFEKFRVGNQQPTTNQPVAAEEPLSDPFARFRISEPETFEAENTLGEEFGAGLRGGVDNMQAMLYGLGNLVGRETGINSLKEWGWEGAQRNFQEASQSGRESGGFGEIESAGGFWKWAAASLGEAIPSLATAVASGGFGGVAAKKVVENKLKRTLAGRMQRNLTKKGYTQAEAQAASRRVLASEQGAQWLAESAFRGKSSQELMRAAYSKGMKGGAFGGSAAPQIGGTDLELEAAGVDSGFTSLLAGTVGGALETLPALKMLDNLFPGVDSMLSKQFVKDLAVATGKQHLIEGGTEAAQEMIQMAALAYHDPSFDMFSADAKQRVIDAFAAGALVGTVMGAGSFAGGQGILAAKEGAARAAEAAEQLPPVSEWRFRPPENEELPEGFEPADNTFYQELKDRIYGTVGPQLEAAVNSLSQKAKPVLDAINVDMNPGDPESKRLFTVIQEAHNSFVETHKADFKKLTDYFQRRQKELYEAAKSIKDPAKREAFIKTELENMRAQTAAVVERIRRAAQQRDKNAEAEVDNMDFDDEMLGELGYAVDEDGNVVDADTFEPGVTQDVLEEEETRVGPSGRKFTRARGPEQPTQKVSAVDRGAEVGEVEPGPTATFGNYLARPRINNKGKESVKGYPDRKKARDGVARLKEELPTSRDNDFRIREQEDGTFVIDITNGDLKEDIMFNEQIRKARRSADKNKKTGNFKVPNDKWTGKLRGFKGPNLNLMTLAWEGMNLLDNREGASLYEGFQASLAKLMDRGMIDGEVAGQMLEQFQTENESMINDPEPEVYAPVANFPTKGVALATMKNLQTQIENEFDVEYGWPYGMIDVRENADGTWSWGITKPKLFKALRKKNPAQAQAIRKGIVKIRRDEKLNKQPIGPGGRDTGVSADPRGTFAGEPDAPVTQRGERGARVPQPVRNEEGKNVYIDEEGNEVVSENAQELRPTAIARETEEFTQSLDKKTNPDELPSEFNARFQRDNEELGKVDRQPRKKNRETGPKAKMPQTEEDNRLLKKVYGAPGKVKIMMSQRNNRRKRTRKAFRDLTTFVRDKLGLGNDIIVMDNAGLRYMIDNGIVTDPVFNETLTNPKVKARNIRIGNQSFIYLDDSVTTNPAMAVIALGHELGHHVYRTAWNDLHQSKQKELRAAFLKSTGYTQAQVHEAETTYYSIMTGYRKPLSKEEQARADAAKVIIDATSGPESTLTDKDAFNEWMADQLAAWMTRKALPKSAVDRFFFTIGKKLKQLYDFIANNPRFELNETYNEFIEAMVQKARGQEDATNPLGAAQVQAWFKNEGAIAYKWFGSGTTIDNMDVPYAGRQISQATETAMERFQKNYPGIAARAVTLRNWVTNAFKVYVAPSTGVVKAIGKRVKTANEIALMFGRQNHGEAGDGANYHQRVYKMKGQFLEARYGKKIRAKVEAAIKAEQPGLKGRKLQEAVNQQLRKTAKALHKADGNPNAVLTDLQKEVRQLFDDMHKYATDAGLPVGKIDNYFPRQFDRDLLIKDKEKVLRFLDEQLGNREKARAFYNSLISSDATDGRATIDAVETPGFKNMNSRTAQHDFFDQYLDNNLDGIVANYVNAVVKRAEFNKLLGEPMPSVEETQITPKEAIKSGLWDPKANYHRLLRRARKEGATDEELQILEKYIDANLGQLGRDDISPGLRKWMAGAMAYQNMRVLLFTVLASLPDMAGPAIRSGDMRGTFKTVAREIKAMATDDSHLAEMARAYGIISSAANDHIMTEYVDNHYMPPSLRKWNDGFFKWTGLNFYTDFTRKMALAVGIDYLENTYKKYTNPKNEKEKFQAQNAFDELGIKDPEDVRKWLADGKPTYESLVDGPAYQNTIAEALIQFVDESIMRPNAAQRPIMASHPAAMLVYHLKGYLYAVHEVVLKRLKYNIDEAQTPAQYAAAIAPAFLMLALTAIGLEIRELIQYAGSNRKPPTDRMDGWEYTFELLQRSGLTGISQLAFDFQGAEDRGMSHVAGIGGPTLSQFADILSKPSTQTIPKAIPVVGQFPAGRDAVRTVL